MLQRKIHQSEVKINSKGILANIESCGSRKITIEIQRAKILHKSYTA